MLCQTNILQNIYQISRYIVGKLHGASIAGGCVATQSQIEDKLLTGVNFGCLATVAKTDVMSARPRGIASQSIDIEKRRRWRPISASAIDWCSGRTGTPPQADLFISSKVGWEATTADGSDAPSPRPRKKKKKLQVTHDGVWSAFWQSETLCKWDATLI